MSLRARHNQYSVADYVTLEEHAGVKHEYWGGEIYAMAGGTPDHARLCAALTRHIGNELAKGCAAYSSDLRVRIAAADLITYPDVSVICGQVVRALDDRLAAINPVVLVEVTSPSTEAYDRGEKLAAYQQLPSLREVLFASHREPQLIVHSREADGGWTRHEAGAGESLTLSSVNVTVSVVAIYAAGLEDF